ncbi:ComEC/Rec2 family competence protein [Plantibacter flavus]|uniref:ComEC/Rec2 family competence protein n=1 Tax=Plantibacter flavus TaxID=150123 RepID=UPI003F15D80A
MSRGDGTPTRAGASTPFPRLLIPATCAWIAAAACCAKPDSASVVGVVGFAVAVGCLGVVVSVRSRVRLIASLLLLSGCAAAVGLSGAAVQARGADRQPPVLLELGAETVEVEVRVTADGVTTGGALSARSKRYSADLVAVRTTDGRRWEGLKVPAMVFGPTSGDRAPRIGERWRVDGSLKWNEPGDGRAALVFAREPSVPLADAPELLGWSAALRAGLVDIVGALPGPGGELLPGLAIGDTSRLGEELQEAMRRSSLSHLTAVSGANCAIIVWLVTAAAARLGAGRVLRVALALVALGAFVVLVTPQPSVQRAALMAAIVLVLGGFGRPARGLAALALAVVILLVADPWLSVQYGFGLSVLATAGLLLLSGPITALLSRWLPRALAVVIAVPTAAQIACQPMLVLLEPEIQLGGVPANLLAGPAAAPATLLGLLACVLAPFAAPVALGVAWLGWIPATWIGAVAQWFGGLSSARVPWPEGAIGVALLAAPTAAIVLLLLVRERLPRRVVQTLGVGLLVCATLFVGRTVGAGLGTTLHRPSEWIVSACDVGQGDAVLVRAGGQVALVDVGPETAPLRECLTELGVDRISLLVLTHYDLDHVGGLAAVVGRVDEVLLGPVDDPEDARVARVLEEGGARVRFAMAGDAGALGDDEHAAAWRVLWPDPGAGGIEPGNDASVVVRFETPTTSLMFLGDLGEQAQDRLLARHALGGAVDIVKVSHHGSADQSERLAQRLGARVALVSVGADNGYGHPTASALELYEANRATTLRTDELGTVVVGVTDDGRFQLWSERVPPDDSGHVGARR